MRVVRNNTERSLILFVQFLSIEPFCKMITLNHNQDTDVVDSIQQSQILSVTRPHS